MGKKKNTIYLSESERTWLNRFVEWDDKSGREAVRARVLLLADGGKKDREIAVLLGISRPTVSLARRRFEQNQGFPLWHRLKDAPRPGSPGKATGRLPRRLPIATCSEAPQGTGQWQLSMTAGRLVKLEALEVEPGGCDAVAPHKNRLSQWLGAEWNLRKVTGPYLWRMHDVLKAYERDYDPQFPLLCFGARPCCLVEETGGLVAMSPEKSGHCGYQLRRHDAYVFLAFEPHTGQRYTAVKRKKTAATYTQFIQTLVARYYAASTAISLVQDDSTPYSPGSFYESLPAAKALALTQRCSFHYTPPAGAWLNMAEVEFAVLAKRCMERQVDSLAGLRREVSAWTRRGNAVSRKIEWSLTTQIAGRRLTL